MAKVVVIGGGASGIVAAIRASKKHEVILLEGTEKLGKKLLITGNGRANYWNKDIETKYYHTDDSNALEKILSYKEEVFAFLSSLGLYPKEIGNYIYPYSRSANSLRELLLYALQDKVKVMTCFKVQEIRKINDKFLIKSKEDVEIEADKVIVACGSKAMPKTGSDGSLYPILESLGHSIHPILPSLAPLIAKEKVPAWEGVRVDTSVSLYIDGKKINQEEGEVQLTKNGVSGICVFNISGIASRALNQENKVLLVLNFLPFLKTSFSAFLESRKSVMGNVSIEKSLESLFPYKLLLSFLERASIKRETSLESLSEKEIKALEKVVTSFEISITSLDAEKAQVCTGGIPLGEVDKNTFASKRVSNLYIVGECLDVDGLCGGYNLAFAFISGYIAGGAV